MTEDANAEVRDAGVIHVGGDERGAARNGSVASLRQLGDQAVAVTAVERADELDRLAALGPARPLEQECR